MKVEIKNGSTTTLSLNNKEILWLKGIMRHPLYGQSLKYENEKDCKMRNTFWESLNIHGISMLEWL